MATAVYVNLYKSYSDRGAFVQSGLWQSSEVDESEIKVGEQLPQWPSYDGPIVKGYKPGLIPFYLFEHHFHIGLLIIR